MIVKGLGMNQTDLVNLLQSLVNRMMTRAQVRMASTTSQIQVSAFQYWIGDTYYNKGAQDNINVSAMFTATGAGQFKKLRAEIDTGGTVTVKEGAIAGAQVNAGVPRRTANRCTIGWIEIPASFTPGTTAFNVGGVLFIEGDPDLGDGAGVPPNDRGLSQEIYTGP
jgi:hypothetical protein